MSEETRSDVEDGGFEMNRTSLDFAAELPSIVPVNMPEPRNSDDNDQPFVLDVNDVHPELARHSSTLIGVSPNELLGDSVESPSVIRSVRFIDEVVVIEPPRKKNGKAFNVDEIVEDRTHEQTGNEEHFLNLFTCCSKGLNEKTASTKPKRIFKYRHYAFIHFAYIIGCSFFFGTIFYLLEMGNSKTNIPFIDALLMACASVCLCGFLTQPITDITTSSQVCLFFAIISGGLTFTTLPVIILKILRARKRMFVLRNLEKTKISMGLRTTSFSSMKLIKACENSKNPFELTFLERIKDIFVSNGNPFPLTDVEYAAMLWVTIITQVLVGILVSVGFLILGSIFQASYNEEQYMHGKEPFWLGLFISLSAFNNCGLSLLDENLSKFVDNWGVCLTVGIVAMLGNVLFPFALRCVLLLFYKFSTKRKVVFKYILEKHHHLSPYVFSGMQTWIYGAVTLVLLIIGIITTLASEWSSSEMAKVSTATKLLSGIFHPISSRTGGFSVMNLASFTLPTLMVYAFMMRVKPQIACSLKENAYNIMNMIKHLNVEEQAALASESEGSDDESSIMSGGSEISFTSSEVSAHDTVEVDNSLSFLASVGDDKLVLVLEKLHEKEELDALESLEKQEQSVYGASFNKDGPYLRGNIVNFNQLISQSSIPSTPLSQKASHVSGKAIRFVAELLRKYWFYFSTMLSTNDLWLIVLIFAIATAESDKITADPQNYSLFNILFEVISAFANSGLSIGMKGSPLSFCGFWSPFSKIMICFVMIMGRHRGFYNSMIDLEEDSYVQEFTIHANILERRQTLKQFKKEQRETIKKKAQ